MLFKILIISSLLSGYLFAGFFQDSVELDDLFPDFYNNERIDSLNKYALNLSNTNPELQRKIANYSLSLSKKEDYKLGIAEALNIISESYKHLGKSDSALVYYKKAFSNFKLLDNKKWITKLASNIAAEFSTQSLFDSTLAYLRKGMVSAAKSKDSLSIGNLLNRLGLAFWRKGEFKKSIKLYKLALKYRRNIGEKPLIVQSLNNIGSAYYNLGNYKIALEYYFEAIDTRTEYDKTNSPILLNNIGLIYLRLSDIQLAKRNFKKALESAKISNSNLGLGYSYLNLGDLSMKTKEYELALEYYKKSKSFYEELGDINGVAKITNKIGEVYFETKRYKIAQDNFLSAYRICKVNGLKLNLTEVLINISKLLIKRGKNKGVRSNLEKAYKLAKEGGFAKSELKILELQTVVYENLKDYKKALEYQHKYNVLRDSLFDESSLRIVAETKERYESNEREERNVKLQHINSIQKMELENRRRTMIFVSIFVFILFLILAYLIYVNVQRRKKNELLLKTKREIEIINNKLHETNKLLQQSNFTKDKFFSIISHDLKNPFNTLLGATQILQSDFNEMSKEDNNELIEIIANDSQKLYSLLENLLYWANSQTGNLKANKTSILLHQAVAEICSLYKNSAKDKKIAVDIKIPKSVVIIFDEFMFSTIVRNLLSNAIKFTHIGGKILLEAEILDGKVKFCVKDEGVGIEEKNRIKLFDETSEYKSVGTKNEKGTGLGLVLCRDFAKENNAKISVRSELGKGTTFELIIDKG